MKKILIKIIDFYSEYISKGLPRRCRFYPTCSAYTKEAIIEHGAIYGSVLGVFRILRCNPLFKGGYDPVKKSRRK